MSLRRAGLRTLRPHPYHYLVNVGAGPCAQKARIPVGFCAETFESARAGLRLIHSKLIPSAIRINRTLLVNTTSLPQTAAELIQVLAHGANPWPPAPQCCGAHPSGRRVVLLEMGK